MGDRSGLTSGAKGPLMKRRRRRMRQRKRAGPSLHTQEGE